MPAKKTTILAADDDPQLLRLVTRNLELEGYEVRAVSDGQQALDEIGRQLPNLVLLDVMMPRLDGFTVTERVREFSPVPIIIITARGQDQDKIRGLDLGADDYLTKPFSPRTLLARIKALLRRAGMENPAPLAVGRVALDIDEHTVRIDNADPVRLTKLELRLLQMLLANAGHTVSTDRLLLQVWGHRNSADRQLLKQLVHRLRQKIEIDPATPQLLQTAAGAGYKLIADYPRAT